MKILVTGASGQVGCALARRMPAFADATFLDQQSLDLSDTRSIGTTLRRLRPSVVINAAAFTAVDRAEQERDLAFAINAEAPYAIAQACAEIDATLVHVLTDYVFNSRKKSPYVESGAPRPLITYGASNLACERAVLESGAAALVLRTTWVYGDHGGNFLKTMPRLAMERTKLRVVADQRGAPTWVGRLADAALQIVESAVARPVPLDWFTERCGLYHACAAGETSWHAYAQTVIARAASIPRIAGRPPYARKTSKRSRVARIRRLLHGKRIRYSMRVVAPAPSATVSPTGATTSWTV